MRSGEENLVSCSIADSELPYTKRRWTWIWRHCKYKTFRFHTWRFVFGWCFVSGCKGECKLLCIIMRCCIHKLRLSWHQSVVLSCIYTYIMH